MVPVRPASVAALKACAGAHFPKAAAYSQKTGMIEATSSAAMQ
jgi:hypothetical protein